MSDQSMREHGQGPTSRGPDDEGSPEEPTEDELKAGRAEALTAEIRPESDERAQGRP